MIYKKLGEDSLELPAIGQGIGLYTWDDSHISIMQAGIDLGMNFFDTAEGYDGGKSERIIGKAIKGRRDKVIVGTKFSPENSGYKTIICAAEASLKRLETDYIDLYQIHWPNPTFPLEETMKAMEDLTRQGKVRHIGVGNLSLIELKEAQSFSNRTLASIQLEYNLFDRMVEKTILPFCEQNKTFLIAYSPIDQGRVADGKRQRKVLEEIAEKYEKTPAQIALRWLIHQPMVVVIPKASGMKHLQANAEAANFDLSDEDILTIADACARPITYVPPDQIQVSLQGQGYRRTYQTLETAKENAMGNVPSPSDLATTMIKDQGIKPVRLIDNPNLTDRHPYHLVEGRIRYWAWVIAHDNLPIPSYIREDWPDNTAPA